MKKYTVYVGHYSQFILNKAGESDSLHGCRVIAGKNRVWEKGQNIIKIVKSYTGEIIYREKF